MAKLTDKIVIHFEPKGDKGLVNAIKSLDRATKSLLKAQTKLATEGKKVEAQHIKTARGVGVLDTKSRRLAQNNKFLANSFATIRSKLLLLNFAMALGARQLARFTQEASKLDSMSRAFNTLAGGSNKASIAMTKLQKATNKTMTQFDLFQQANNAMILGVSTNSDEMAEMFDMAQRLGDALGKGTKESVESLITGIGRQSRLMLDNIGIIVKSEEAYEAYAEKLGIATDELSDADKKQAFLNATMDAAREKIANLPPEILSAEMRFRQLGTSLSELSVRIGQELIPMVLGSTEALTEFIDAIDQDDMIRVVSAVEALAASFVLLRGGAMLLNTTLALVGTGATALGATLMASGIGILVGGIVISIQQMAEAYNKQRVALIELIKKTTDYRNELEELRRLTDPLGALEAEVRSAIRIKEIQLELAKELEAIKIAYFANIDFLTNEHRNKTEVENQVQHEKQLAAQKLAHANSVAAEFNYLMLLDALRTEDIGKQKEAHKKALSEQKQLTEGQKAYIEVTSSFGTVAQGVSDVISAAAGEDKNRQIMAMRIAQFAAIANTAASATKVLRNPIKLAAVLAAGAAQVMTINNAISQAEGVQAYAKGGDFVTNKPEMIMVGESGREHVRITPIDRPESRALKDGMTINFNNAIMSEDFTRDQIIPQIQQAVRMNLA